MHLDPQHVEAYFIKADPNLRTSCEIIGDVIWAKASTNMNPGMMNKTLLAMEHFVPRLKKYDYVIRTNLSSFYVFPRLFTFLKTLPKSGCYCAYVNENLPTFDLGGKKKILLSYGSGAGLIFSPDIVQLLVSEKKLLWNQDYQCEDVVIGAFLRKQKIAPIWAPRFDILTLEMWATHQFKIPQDAFHIRIKNPEPVNRLMDDIYIHRQVLKMFYNVSI